jgi:predicted exporter
MLQETDPEEADRPWTLIVIPERPPGDPKFCQLLLAGLEEVVPEAIWMAGPHVSIGQSARDIRNDLARTSALALLLIVLVLSVGLRSARATLLVLPPLLIADLVALAVSQVIAGSINFYTSMGSAILLGLGVDFAIHLVSRYREERGNGIDREGAVIRAWDATGPACITAGLTSAVGFFALLFADFQGVSQLGMLLGFGVIACLGMMLLTLPLLLLWLDPPPRLPSKVRLGVVSRPKLTVGVYLFVTVLMALLLPRFGIEYDISKLRKEGMAWEELTPKQQELRQAAFPPVVVTTEDSATAQREFAEKIRHGDWPHVLGAISIDSLLPPDQSEHMVAIEHLVRVANHHLLKNLDIAKDSEIAILQSMDVTPMTLEDLPMSVRHLLGAGFQRVFLLLQGNMADLREAQALSLETADLADHAANEFLAQASMIELISNDLPRIALLVLLVVTLIVTLHLRRIRQVIIAVAGLLFSLIWAAGALVLAGVQINLFNIVALPMMLGMGIDTLVHMLHRLRERNDTAAALHSTGLAALLSTLTSVAAFFALTQAVSRGVQSIGEAVVVGLTAAFLSAIVFVPAVWQLLQPQSDTVPGAA